MLKKFAKKDASEDIIKFINKLASQLGVGDDVSIGVVLKGKKAKAKKNKRKK
jgi:hypothetical protein